METKRNIAIVCGGDSSEHNVSLRSAQGLYSFFDKERYHVLIVEIKGTRWQVNLPDGTATPIDRNDFSYTIEGKKHYFDYAYITITAHRERTDCYKATSTSSVCPTPPATYW